MVSLLDTIALFCDVRNSRIRTRCQELVALSYCDIGSQACSHLSILGERWTYRDHKRLVGDILGYGEVLGGLLGLFDGIRNWWFIWAVQS